MYTKQEVLRMINPSKKYLPEHMCLSEKQNSNQGIRSSLSVRPIVVPNQKDQIVTAHFAFLVAKTELEKGVISFAAP